MWRFSVLSSCLFALPELTCLGQLFWIWPSGFWLSVSAWSWIPLIRFPPCLIKSAPCLPLHDWILFADWSGFDLFDFTSAYCPMLVRSPAASTVLYLCIKLSWAFLLFLCPLRKLNNIYLSCRPIKWWLRVYTHAAYSYPVALFWKTFYYWPTRRGCWVSATLKVFLI